jgi:hypothetical protein
VATIGAEHNGVGPASTGLDAGVDERIVDVLGVPDPDVAIGETSGESATGTIESESHHMASGSGEALQKLWLVQRTAPQFIFGSADTAGAAVCADTKLDAADLCQQLPVAFAYPLTQIAESVTAGERERAGRGEEIQRSADQHQQNRQQLDPSRVTATSLGQLRRGGGWWRLRPRRRDGGLLNNGRRSGNRWWGCCRRTIGRPRLERFCLYAAPEQLAFRDGPVLERDHESIVIGVPADAVPLARRVIVAVGVDVDRELLDEVVGVASPLSPIWAGVMMERAFDNRGHSLGESIGETRDRDRVGHLA